MIICFALEVQDPCATELHQNKGRGFVRVELVNPYPAKPGYTLPLQTVQIQISWLLKKPSDLDLHCLPLSMLIYSNNPDQVI